MQHLYKTKLFLCPKKHFIQLIYWYNEENRRLHMNLYNRSI